MPTQSQATPVANTPVIPKFTLCPSKLTYFHDLDDEIVNGYQHALHGKNNGEVVSYHLGCLEGNLAYSLATKSMPDSPEVALYRCQNALLLTFGLEGDNLNAQQSRQKGWVVGLFAGITEAINSHLEAIGQGDAE